MLFTAADRVEPILAPTFLRNPVTIHHVSIEQAGRLETILEQTRRTGGATPSLFDRFTLSGDVKPLLELQDVIQQDVRLSHERPFFIYQGRPMRARSEAETLNQLEQIDDRAHIATVGEVFVLLAARFMTLTERRILVPTLSLSGTHPGTDASAWLTLERVKRLRHDQPNIRVQMLSTPHGARAHLALLVRAHKTPFRVNADIVYRNQSQGKGS